MPKQERRRAVSALVTIVFSIFILVAPLVAMAIAQNAPRVAFLNPSDYDAGASDAPIVVSDRPSGNDEEESPNETTYRLSAYTANTPADPVVEFELVVFDELLGEIATPIGTAVRKGPDAFEYDWDSSTAPNGSYTLRAILYSGSGATGVEVHRTEQEVVVNNTNTSSTADILYPANGAPTGFYVNPHTGQTNTVIRVEFSAGTTTVRGFYTLSDPGDAPIWKPCTGATAVQGGILGDSPQATTGGILSLRCVVESIDQGGQQVTGLAVVSNNAQRRVYSHNTNQAGDAVRPLPYLQDAASATLNIDTQRVDGLGEQNCSPTQTITVLDQLGNPIAGMDVDAHSRGPNDALKYDTGGFFTTPDYDNQPPDNAHSGQEQGADCFEEDPRQRLPLTQGEHNLPGAGDVKHVEWSTDNTGTWGISLMSPVQGESQITMWADEDGDDLFCDDEPSVVASVGWNAPASPPTGETATVTDCPIPTPPPPTGTITPSTSGPGPGPECTIEGTEGDDFIQGTEGNDIICAGAGDDEIDGFDGDDIIRGESGNDIVQGGTGDDTLDGGSGNDRLNGGFHNDVIDGFAGTDVLVGGDGDDVLRGQTSLDGLQGGTGSDVLQSGTGDDVADGQAGGDILKGFNGEDILRGAGGGDTIRGMNHNDQLTGGGGNDRIDGGRGRDQCSGGAGRDKLRKC